MTVQRWQTRSTRYQPAHESIDTANYEVTEIEEDKQVKQFVLEHHYSASYPAARWRFGLFRLGGVLVGVAVFSHPSNDKVLTNIFPGEARESVELGRFILLDNVPSNGETWFLGQSFRRLKRIGLRGVVAFSDPIPRTNIYGDVVFKGHIGTIYQAHNGAYLGRSTPRVLKLLPDGQVLSDRSLQKIRSGKKGWQYAAKILEGFGAEPCQVNRRHEWLTKWLPRLTRNLRHSGNHRYAWSFERKHTLVSFAYPKRTHTSKDRHIPTENGENMLTSSLSPAPDVELSPELQHQLDMALDVYAVAKDVLDTERARIEAILKEAEISRASNAQFSVNITTGGVSTSLDKKKLIALGVSPATLEAATTRRPKKPYLTIRAKNAGQGASHGTDDSE